MEVDRKVLIAALKEHNPELQAMDFDIERLDKEVGVAKRNFYPDIGVVRRMDADAGVRRGQR